MTHPRHALSSLSILTLGLVLQGCQAPLHTEHFEELGSVRALTVDVGSGDVTIRGADVSGVQVTARIEGDTNHLAHALDGERLMLFDDCQESHCSVDIQARVPRAVPIELRTGSGDVRMIEMRGNVNVETGSGDIDGTALEGADVSAHTGSGDVTLETLAAETIYVQTGSGDVKLWVPSGEYQLDVTSGSGDRTIRGVTDAARATSEIYVHTGSGDLVILGR